MFIKIFIQGSYIGLWLLGISIIERERVYHDGGLTRWTGFGLWIYTYWWQWHVKRVRRIHNRLNSHVLMTKLFRKLGLCQDLIIIRRLTWPLTQHQRSPSLECKKNQSSFTNQRIEMTISYGQQVATSSGLGVFWKLLFLWRGSIYKLVWTNLALYIFLYYSLSLTYRFLLDENGRVRLLLRDLVKYQIS